MSRRNKLVAGGAALLVAGAAGGAIAATTLTPRQETQAVINDAADQLGVQPRELSNALKQALKNRVDAAVEDGRLTKEQGARMKQRIEANEVPLLGLAPGRFGRPGHHEHHFLFHAKLEAAAEYLGITGAQLRAALRDGKTLAQVARDRDKSVDGLIDALVERAETKLDEDVEAGRLTKAEKREMLVGIRERITDVVNGRFPLLRPRAFRRFSPGAEFRSESF
jgi:hypothetical protein